MSARSFVIWLALAAVTLAGAVAAVLGQPEVREARLEGDPVFAALRENPDAVARITLGGAEGAITLARGEDGGWRAEEKAGYPVDAAKVRELVVTLADLRFVEPKTSAPALLPRLELEDPEGEDAKSRLLALADAAGESLGEAVIGKRSSARTGRDHFGSYLRRPDRDQAWLVNREVELDATVTDWLVKEIVNVSASEIAEIAVTPTEGEAYAAARGAREADFAVDAALPEGKVLDQAAVKRLAGGVSYLTLSDVRPAAEVAFPETPAKARFTSFDGLVVEAEVATVDGKQWARFKAVSVPAILPPDSAPTGEPAEAPAVEQPAAERGDQAAEGEEQTAETKDEELETQLAAAAEERAAELNAKLAPWVYELTAFAADRLRTPLEKLAKDPDGTS